MKYRGGTIVIFFSALLQIALCADEPLTGSAATQEGIEETIIQVLQTGMHSVDLLEEESILSKCKVSSQVTCKVSNTGQDCEELVVPIEQCGDINLDFTFTYCNLEDEFIALKSDRTSAVVDAKAVNGLNFSNLNRGECRSETFTRSVNTCRRFFSASLKVEGLRGGRPGGVDQDYCYAWDFLRIFIKRECQVTSEVSCTVLDTGEDCMDIIRPSDACGMEDMVFTFNYCNNESTTLELHKQKTLALIETEPIVPNLDFANIPPQTCRTITVPKTIDTCKRFFSARLKVEGWRGDGPGDYCFAWDFFRSYPIRPDGGNGGNGGNFVAGDGDCTVTARVKSCNLFPSGEDCDAIVVPLNSCNEEEAMIFEFEYCNFETDDEKAITLIPQRTIALIETVSVSDLNTSKLQPGQCHIRREYRTVNTCKRFFSASLKVEGWRQYPFYTEGNYCYAYDFYRSYVTRPAGEAGGGGGGIDCDVTADVQCTLESTGQDCAAAIYPLNQCSRNTPMIFSFEYCNQNPTQFIDLKEDVTVALVETQDVAGLNESNIPPGQCRRLVVTRNINTCKRFFSASLKVEGLRNGVIGDYCYGWDFYRNYFKRLPDINNGGNPNPPPADNTCAVSATVSCTVDGTGQDCEDIIVPIEACNTATPMTFEFEYCNNNLNQPVSLHEDKTIALVETVPVALNNADMRAGECFRKFVKRNINTCKRFFSASLKVEGLLADESDYCYAWDFYRVFVARPGGTPAPSPAAERTDPPTVACAGITGPERETLIRSIVSNVSNPVALNTPGTPQFRALNWLINVDTYNVFCAADCNRDLEFGGVVQRYTLAVFYFSTNGDTWATCGRNSVDCVPQLTISPNDPIDTFFGSQTWLSSAHECLWGGVSCRTSTECLDRIEFEGENVNGVIPFELEQLFELRYLYLEGANNDQEYDSNIYEYLTGTIPPQLQALTELLVLDLNYNKLSGALPAALWNLTGLRQLDLDHNLFTGTITGNNLKRLQNLQFLQVNDNLFTGQVPNFGDQNALNGILVAEFHNNGFTEDMPPGNCRLRDIGLLATLSADCLGGAAAPVPCELNICCTECF